MALLHSPLGGADPFTERQLRQGLRALALAADDRRPSGELLVDALTRPQELALVERRWAAPAKAVAELLRIARETAATPGATVEDVLWRVWSASGLAERWSTQRDGEAADRDLDAVVALFDAAARFTDRLPGARTEAFLDHLAAQELPADSLAPTADRGEAVRLLTVHAAKGLSGMRWLPGVQEACGRTCLRDTLLGAEQLVDLHAGRDLGPVGRTSALLDEERRLILRRRHLGADPPAGQRVAPVSVGEGEGGAAEPIPHRAGP